MCGFSAAQYLKFCLFTFPFKWKCASSDIIRWFRNCVVLSIICKSFLQHSLRCFKSRGRSCCTSWILKGWNFKSSCKMRRTVLGVKCTAIEWRRAECWGLRWNACATRRTFSCVRTVRGRPGGFLLTMDAVFLNCVTQFNIVHILTIDRSKQHP
jgi:hypothetical protein